MAANFLKEWHGSMKEYATSAKVRVPPSAWHTLMKNPRDLKADEFKQLNVLQLQAIFLFVIADAVLQIILLHGLASSLSTLINVTLELLKRFLIVHFVWFVAIKKKGKSVWPCGKWWILLLGADHLLRGVFQIYWSIMLVTSALGLLSPYLILNAIFVIIRGCLNTFVGTHLVLTNEAIPVGGQSSPSRGREPEKKPETAQRTRVASPAPKASSKAS